jgi:hypothetical protein
MFVKDPLTGRRTARLRPPAEWQVTEHPSLRLIEPDAWETVEAKFQRLAQRRVLKEPLAAFEARRGRGRSGSTRPRSRPD